MVACRAAAAVGLRDRGICTLIGCGEDVAIISSMATSKYAVLVPLRLKG